MPKLGLGLGLNKGRGLFGFNPLSLDPYLLFDSRSSMKGELEATTLDLDPSNPDSLDVITASRSGVATYTDADGLIQTADPNTVRVDHVQGEELTPTVYQHILYTDFSTGWSLINATKEAANTPSPSPSYNAIRVTAQNSIYGRLQDYIGVSQNTTISVYVKRDGVDTLFQISSQNNGSSSFNINESGVSIESNGGLGYDIQEHGNGWWRVSASFAGVGYVQFIPDNEFGTRSVLLAMPQVEEGTTATDFVPNTTGSPKFIASATYADRVPMMLIEPSATNLIQNSEDFTQDVVLSNCSVQGGFTAPDGSTNAFKLVEDNTNSFKLFQAVNNTATTAGTTYTASIFVKAGERTKVRVWSYHLFNQHWWVDYDLQGNILLDSGDNNGQLEGYAIEDYSDGWKRISVTGQKPASTYSWDVGVSILGDNGTHTYQGDGTSGVYIWGAQFEQGSVATSYIPNPAPISDNLNSVTSIEADGSVGGYSSFHIEAISAGIIGKTVRVSFEVYDYEAGIAAAFAGNNGGPDNSIPASGIIDGNGVYSRVVVPNTSDSLYFRNSNGAENFKGKIRNISVVEVDTSGVRNADDLVLRDRTNFIENTDFSGWVQASYTTLTDGEGYDGQPSKIFEATSGTNRTFRGNTFATTAGTTYVGSFWIRRVSGTGTINLVHQYSATANITNITSELSEEWTFVERTFLGNASSGDVYFGVWVGDQGDAVEIAMPQVEVGSEATRFIETSGSAVTRNDFSGFFNTTEGTFYVEADTREISNQYLFDVVNSSLDNQDRVIVFIQDDAETKIYLKANGNKWVDTNIGLFSTNGLQRVAYSYAANNSLGSLNGAAEVSDPDSISTPPTNVNQIYIGARYSQTAYFNGHIKRLIYWPTHSDSL